VKSLQRLKMVNVPEGEVQISLEDKLVKAVDDYLVVKNQNDFKRVDGFHPSYTNQCARYWVYLFRGVSIEPTFTGHTYRIFDNGHAVHDRLYDYFRNMGILLEEEIPVDHKDPPVRGTADGIIDWDGRKLIELKSISQEGFHYRQLHNKPKDDHIRQAQVYMRCLDLDDGFVIYENKNNQQILPIYMERDDAYIDKLFKKWSKWYQGFLDDKLPVRPYKITSPKCQNCDAKAFCWGDNEEGVKL